MAPVTYQTIRLSRGKHSSPEEGACVMELASMIAGEPFSDRPASACPVIGSFMRTYNDWVDDTRRQDLYAYAAKLVGSRASEQVERARAQRLTDFALSIRRGSGFLMPMRARVWRMKRADMVGIHVGQAIARRGYPGHADVLALIDELLAIGTPSDAEGTTSHRCIAPTVTSASTAPSTAPATTSPG